MIKLVIFDMDGLMFDTECVTYRAVREEAAKRGYEFSLEQYKEIQGLNANATYKKYREFLGEEVDAETMYKNVGDRRKRIISEEGLKEKKGLRELLAYIDEMNVKKAVASGSDQDVVERNIAQAGLSDYFDLLLSAKGMKRGKPFPDIFLRICDYFAVMPEESLVFEDSSNGVEAALAGSLPVIHVPDMQEIPDHLKNQCLAVADSLDQAIPVIRKYRETE